MCTQMQLVHAASEILILHCNLALNPSVVAAECVGINAKMWHKVVYNRLTNEQMSGC